MVLLFSRGAVQLSYIIVLISAFVNIAVCQNCSATNPCQTGCCSIYGYCGTGSTYCDPSVCVDTCNYTPTSQCDENNLCVEGCCSTYGVCGYGPDYCSAENCVSTCDAKSECDPDNWGTAFANSTDCPLNVCCDKYGFCGTTTEFCGTKTVQRPSCSTTSSRLSRVVGYYEGWAPTRPCDTIWPEQIPLGVYTHLNYAFASIDPTTFEVVPASNSEVSLYTRLTDLKNQDPDLRVNIAIGGWSFNDPGPTATTFSDLAASESNQKAFFKSLISFMATYNFDGVDIDWEYPGAADRSGRPEDFANLPTFMANLKNALISTGGRDELSMTLPASYWYLQNFDIETLSSTVDYFNFMTYDLHGTWDQGNVWTGAYLDSHTNLTEITLDLDLLWRNNVPPAKVNLGLAFYGRSFTLADSSCTEPGCMFASGGNPGDCSLTTSMLMNSEIDSIRAANQLTPTLDNSSAVEILTWNDQWTTYDDETTLRLKTDFARSECLGGVMVWAVSHDNSNGSYSEALAGVAKRPFTSYQLSTNSNGSAYLEVATQNTQCMWTGCGETCPSDYVTVSRGDSGARKGELMLDGTACPTGTTHTLCCPSSTTVPQCGWYTHNNGNCNSACPINTHEVGSNSQYCKNNDYQAACCETGLSSTQLYSTLEWSQAPLCDSGTCPWADSSDSTTLTSSASGSGGAKCNMRSAGWIAQNWVIQERKLCADTSNSDKTWDGCDWYDNLGPTSSGRSSECASSCPTGKVRVAMDQYGGGCLKNGGARSYCCDANYITYSKEDSPTLTEFETDLDGFLPDPYCGTSSSLSAKRSHEEESDIIPRASTLKTSPIDMAYFLGQALVTLLQDKVYTQLESAEEDYWNSKVPQNFSNLDMDTIQKFANNSTYFYYNGPTSAANDLVCRLPVYNDLVLGIIPPACVGDVCAADVEPDLCEEEDDEDDDVSLSSRMLGRDEADGKLHWLEKRAKAKSYSVWCASTNTLTTGLKYQPQPYPSAGKWTSSDPQYNSARNLVNEVDCGNPQISPQIKTSNIYDTEHIVELQVIGQFIEYFTRGTLMSDDPASFQAADCSIFLPTSQGGLDLLNNPTLLRYKAATGPGQSSSAVPIDRIMTALGSTENAQNLYLLRKQINGMKSRVFRNVALVSDTKMSGYIADTSTPGKALKLIRDAIAVWWYLKDDAVAASLVEIANNVRAQLALIEEEWNDNYPASQVDLVAAWDQWFPDMMRYHANRTLNWVLAQITNMTLTWALQAVAFNPMFLSVATSLASLYGWSAAVIHFDPSGLTGQS